MKCITIEVRVDDTDVEKTAIAADLTKEKAREILTMISLLGWKRKPQVMLNAGDNYTNVAEISMLEGEDDATG